MITHIETFVPYYTSTNLKQKQSMRCDNPRSSIGNQNFIHKIHNLLSNKLFLWYNSSKFHLNNLKSRSKKIILLFLIFFVIGGAVFLLLKQKNVPEVKKITEVKTINSPIEALNIDSDGDGLKDWEETLWGMDPHSPDTGSTGVPDAEKVKKRIKEINTAGLKKDSIDGVGNNQYATDTETALVSKKLFAEYINLKQSGNFNEESVNAAVNNLVAEEIQNKKVVQYYFPKDIKTFPSDNKILLKAYGNSFASIRAKYQKQYLQNPLVKEGETANFLDPEFLKGLVRVSDSYKNMAMELSKLSVPEDLVQIQMEILNNYRASSDGFKELSTLTIDPVVAIIGTQRHIEATAKENGLLKTIAKNLFDNGIIFSENEPGYTWNNI